jgi:hypothetical protein
VKKGFKSRKSGRLSTSFYEAVFNQLYSFYQNFYDTRNEYEKIDNGDVFSFGSRSFKVICENTDVRIPPKTYIDILLSPRFGMKAMYKGQTFVVVAYAKPKRENNENSKSKPRKVYTPPDDHYFKHGHILWPKLSFTESNQEILEMLEDVFLKKYA